MTETAPQNIPRIAESPNQNYNSLKGFVNNKLGIVLPTLCPLAKIIM